MEFKLRCLSHDFILAGGRFAIGRSDDCQLSLDDPLVSRRHATLDVRTDGVMLSDLGTRNGTYLNSVRINGQSEVQDGDKITIGSAEMFIAKV
ncbi:FHA domain-containing protein [Inquilinus sp.]|uniref:FHA domain-containing protein n=1 Tax=Inquilinus sp. TaxID=1932117 RepID=UPI0031CF2884